MKTLSLLTALLVVFSMAALAQKKETFALGVGAQKTSKKARLKIKFLAVTEDSRCPIGVDCIWEGNSKVKVEISNSRRSQIFEFNTNVGPKGDIFDGWAIRIDDLEPYPKANKPIDPKAYRVKFIIERLSR